MNRNKLGQFAGNILTQTKRALRWTLKISITSIIGALIVVAFSQYHIANADKEMVTVEVEKVVDTGIVKVQNVKNEIIYQLKQCESGTKKESDALIVFDTNKKPSLGLWQFQVGTVQYYYKTLYGKDITSKEAVSIALDETLARELVADIMFKTNNAPQEWFNCSKKLDLKLKIDLLKKL